MRTTWKEWRREVDIERHLFRLNTVAGITMCTCGLLFVPKEEASDYVCATTYETYALSGRAMFLAPEGAAVRGCCPICRLAAREAYRTEQWAKANPELVMECMKKHAEVEKP